MSRKRVAILISGRGSNAKALIEASREPAYPGEIVGVLSDHASAAGLAMAQGFGIATAVIEQGTSQSRADHEAAVQKKLTEWRVEFVCLAGYMRILSSAFVTAWHGRLLNIHPSLLPAFPGLDTHRRALERGVVIHGCTVHLVTEGVDEGPILAQATVQVRSDDMPEGLAARVLAEEHHLYPTALADWIEGRTRLVDGRVVRSATREP